MTAEEKLLENGYEGTVIFSDFSYDDALCGVSHDGRAIYDYDKMVIWPEENEGMTEEEAREWIDYNSIRALGYAEPGAPIVMYSLME